MGSRLQPNHGGSGFPHSRKSRPARERAEPIKYSPIETIEELNLYLASDKITCLICGGEYKSLGHHLSRSHSMSARQYKIAHNIPVTRSLAGCALKEEKRRIMLRTWEESPAMEGVRDSLKKNIHNLDGTRHKTKCTLPLNSAKIKAAKIIQQKMVDKEYRKKYMEIINGAIDSGDTLYGQHKKIGAKGSTSQIYSYSRRHPEDKEFSQRLKMVKAGAKNKKAQTA